MILKCDCKGCMIGNCTLTIPDLDEFDIDFFSQCPIENDEVVNWRVVS